MAIDGLHPASSRESGVAFAFNAIVLRHVRHVRRFGPLAAIILLHIAFFQALQSGLLRQAVAALPNEVLVSFITPESPPAPPAPKAAQPKTVPVVKKQTVAPRPAPPVVNTTPSQQAITTPPSDPIPAPAMPSAPAAPVAPVAPVAPTAPPAPAMPRTMTSGIEYLHAPQPDYPPLAKRMGEQGKTILRVLVNDKGRPERVDVQTTSGYARLDEAARQAVLRALFKPFMEDGKAVAAYAIVPIRFQLD